MKLATQCRPLPDVIDSELATTVQLCLNASRTGYRGITVQAECGTVRLSGSTCSFFHRQMAVELAKRIAGVCRVVDHLEVDWQKLPSHGDLK